MDNPTEKFKAMNPFGYALSQEERKTRINEPELKNCSVDQFKSYCNQICDKFGHSVVTYGDDPEFNFDQCFSDTGLVYDDLLDAQALIDRPELSIAFFEIRKRIDDISIEHWTRIASFDQ